MYSGPNPVPGKEYVLPGQASDWAIRIPMKKRRRDFPRIGDPDLGSVNVIRDPMEFRRTAGLLDAFRVRDVQTKEEMIGKWFAEHGAGRN